MTRVTTLALFALLAACETIPHAGAGKCNGARVQNFVGALGTASLATAMLKRSGARTIRWLAPGSMATMDYRMDRLNVRIDERNFVVGLNCG